MLIAEGLHTVLIMKIEIYNKKSDEFVEQLSVHEMSLFSFKWRNLNSSSLVIISDEIFFHLDLDIHYKKSGEQKKMILMAEYNNKFWFFKILNEPLKGAFSFSVKKPLLERINEINLFVIDWYKIIKNQIPGGKKN